MFSMPFLLLPLLSEAVVIIFPFQLNCMRKKIVVTAVLVLFVIAGSLVSSSFADKYAVSLSYKLIENGFAGSEACMPCHKSIYDNFVSTAHNLTSRPAAEFIKGSTKKGENRYSYNPFVF